MLPLRASPNVRLARIEDIFRSAWTGINSTPFLVDAPISTREKEEAEAIVNETSLESLFNHCPTLATWAVLTPLAQHYGDGSLEVYSHISRFVGKSLSDQDSRNWLKHRYRLAARKLGLPVSGTNPTDLFFAPLGPAKSQYSDLADAFVASSLRFGPPAIEDTPSARAWQRQAVFLSCPNHTRLKETISFDQSAHCALRFEAWRQGKGALSDNEVALFSAYDAAISRYGRTRRDLTGPPKIFWTGDRLGIEAEASNRAQSVKIGPFPTQIKGGARISVDPPWRQAIPWTCGGVERGVPFGPETGEVLVFDADSGALLFRADPNDSEIEVAAERLVILAAENFTSASFGAALEASDKNHRVAWISPGEKLQFASRSSLDLKFPKETAIWIDGEVLGRAGSRALLCGDGALVIKLDPDIGGSQRIIRAKFGDQIKYTSIECDAKGMARIPFARFNFAHDSAPARSVFEVLAPGAAGDPGARSELSVAAWLWPSVTRSNEELKELPLPSNFNAARSAGLRKDGPILHIDLRADIDAPILGLNIEGDISEFALRTGTEKLVHNHVESGNRNLVPRGAQIILGHQGRHDTLLLKSSDRDANLLVLGSLIRRPFFMRSQIEINAEMLDHTDGGDDRIALKRKDGRIEIFARVVRRKDPADIRIEEDDQFLHLFMTPSTQCDALLILLEAADGKKTEGEIAIAGVPVETSAPPGVTACCNPDTGAIRVQFDKFSYTSPTRALVFYTRSGGDQIYRPLEDVNGYRVAIGLGTSLKDPDQRGLAGLAKLLTDPIPVALQDQINDTIGRAYKEAFDHVGKPHMVGAIRPVLDVCRPDGGSPRHDLIGVAPWIFESTFQAFRELKEETGLSALNNIGAIKSVPDLPDPEGDTPLAKWIGRIDNDPSLPVGLDATAIKHGFQTLRFRLKETDLRDLTGDGRIGISAHLICASWSDTTENLRSFDSGGGGDDRPARIATAIERFARAAALRQTEAYIEALVFRTGLSRADIGITLTLMLRASIELFVHFLALWSHACDQMKERQ